MISRRGVLIGGCAAAFIDIGGSSSQTTGHSKSFNMDIDIKRNGSRPLQNGSEELVHRDRSYRPALARMRLGGARVR